MRQAAATPIQRDWLSKSLAGTLLGLGAALAVSAIFNTLATGMPLSTRSQLCMWMVVPVWIIVLSTSYLFQNGRSAWLWLSTINAVLAALCALLRYL
ncbi:hypothetical protein KSF73_15835 [Burkholderiaceae bacterium DAT-1]|nr:hypothetical protein [Burkholderiaceae bacterium DAT-1]